MKSDKITIYVLGGFPGNSAGTESACNAGDTGSIPVSGRSPGNREPTPVLLETFMDRGAWRDHRESDMTEQLTLPYIKGQKEVNAVIPPIL